MVKEVARRITVPEGVSAEISASLLKIIGPKGELSRRLTFPGIEIKLDGSDIVVNSLINRKKNRAMVGTIAAHISNMIKGVTEGFEYRMKVVYSHFPIQLKATSDEVTISNFLGERKARSAKIVGGSKVEIGKDELTIRGIDCESVGQTMANLEQATRVRGFDIRVFQDGIYMVGKR